MKRERLNINKSGVSPNITIPAHVYSELVGRLRIGSRLGLDTYGGDRDIYNALGYPKEITFENYYSRYIRQDIAKAIIDRPVTASWKGTISVIENVSKRLTPFEKGWSDLYRTFNLKSLFIRADKLTGLGRYSIILLGLSDAPSIESLKTPVSKRGNLTLKYVKAFSELSVKISDYDEVSTSERYGLPLYYEVNVITKNKETTVKVHYSRVVHLVEDPLENETMGTPRLQAVYNRLIDIEKLVGGDAEMFWRGARPGYTGTVDKDYQFGDTAFTALQSQIDEYENNLRRILVNEGVTYKALEQQIADPSPHVDVQITLISAKTGIPKRILSGSERGELSSAQDKMEWISYVSTRREEQNEPMILRPFINKCVEIGIVPPPAEEGVYTVVWDKLFAMSDKERVDMGLVRAQALKEFTQSQAQELIPIEVLLEYFLVFDPVMVEEVMSKMNGQIFLEPEVTEEEDSVIKEEKTDKSDNSDNV